MSMIGNFRRISPAKLEQLIAAPDSVVDFLNTEPEFDLEFLDVDKAWHGIHFLLTGSQWKGDAPLGNAVLGGIEFGDDVGYGPAKYITAKEVAEVHSALSRVSVDELMSRLDLNVMREQEIYPSAWRNLEEEQAYLGGYYVALLEFYAEAAKAGGAVLKYVN